MDGPHCGTEAELAERAGQSFKSERALSLGLKERVVSQAENVGLDISRQRE